MTRLRALPAALKELGIAALILVLARDAGGLGAVVITAAVLGAVFTVSRWRWPYKPCRRCKATGRNKGSSSRRHGDCRRCGGTRRVQRPGARTVHRLILTIRTRVRDKEK